MVDPPREPVGGPVRSPTSPGKNTRQESCCLYVWVLRDSNVVLEQDRKMPDYCWNTGICKDICEAKTRVLPGTFSVDLLSHQTLQHMIGKLDPEKRRKWPVHIGSIIIAYNSTRSLVTGYSPYYLMFGCRPRLPIDLLFPMHQMQMLTRTIDEYVTSLYDRLRESLAIAQDCAVKEAQRQKWLYDRKVGAVELRPGDHILVHLDAFRGQRRKLKNGGVMIYIRWWPAWRMGYPPM